MIMSFTISAFNHAEWQRHGLVDYGDFADHISECNVGEDAFSGFDDWFYIPEETLPNGDRVIYFGSWGNDNCPGASVCTYAEVFGAKEIEAFQQQVEYWQSQPEWLEEEVEEDTE
jgi:hypothetical protein